MKKKASEVEGAGAVADNGTPTPRRSARLAVVRVAPSETASSGENSAKIKKKKISWNAPVSPSRSGESESVSLPSAKRGRPRRSLGLDLIKTAVLSPPKYPATRKTVRDNPENSNVIPELKKNLDLPSTDGGTSRSHGLKKSETSCTGESCKKNMSLNPPVSPLQSPESGSVSCPRAMRGRPWRSLGLNSNETSVLTLPECPAASKTVRDDSIDSNVFPDLKENLDLQATDDGRNARSQVLKKPETRKYTEEQKGKRKLFVEDDDLKSTLEIGIGPDNGLEKERIKEKENLVSENGDYPKFNGLEMIIAEDEISGTDDLESLFNLRKGEMDKKDYVDAMHQIQHEKARKRIAESQRVIAAKLAPKFAVTKPQQMEVNEDSEVEDSENEEPEDWPGPFSTAMKIINDREKLLKARSKGASSPPVKFSELKMDELPSPIRETKSCNRGAPPLRELCLDILSEYASDIKSLEGVPDYLKNQLSRHLCNLRKMDEQAIELFFTGSPSEINIPDCSWATEDQLEKLLERISTDRLAILELNMCGRCLHDKTLFSSRNLQPRFPMLTTLSLSGAYRLSDEGLKELTLSAPRLACVDLSQCSRITSAGVNAMLQRLENSLIKVVLDDCSIDGGEILSGLQRLEKLEGLSLTGAEGVTDKFVRSLVSVRGARLTYLCLCGCRALTGASLKEIGKHCPQLRCLDLRDLVKLNDLALAHLASGCSSLCRLRLRRNSFSDKAMAAFLETAGGALIDLTVNNIQEVSNSTARAIARKCAMNLETLDVSFCRKMTNEGLALIVGSCPRLHTLKLFGCSQISPTFLKDYTPRKMDVIGIEGPILRHLRRPLSAL